MFLSICLLTALVGAPPNKDADVLAVDRLNADIKAVDAIRAVKGSEVHAVGVSGPVVSGFNAKEVEDWPEFVKQINAEAGPGARVRGLLTKETSDRLGNKALVARIDGRGIKEVSRLKGDLAFEIRKLLRRPDLYDPEAFKGVELDKDMKRLLALGNERTHIQTARMNRALLTVAFPKALRPTPEDYHAARVLVKNGKPTVLALCSYTACEWRVEMEKGAEVVGVVLCGGEPQGVVGVNCPVVYRAETWPDGARRSPRRDAEAIPICHDLLSPSYQQFEAGVKSVAGKSLTTFQGKHTAPKEGFVVKPSAK
jgi:hypothetical protein